MHMDGFGSERRSTEIVVSGRNSGAGMGANQIQISSQSHSPELASRVPTPSASSTPWAVTDWEMKRKKRIARYKVYSVEGKVKASIKAGLRWIKNKCSQIVHGY